VQTDIEPSPMNRGYEEKSQPLDGDYHLVNMAEDVFSWLNFLNISSAHIVGHDWGSLIALITCTLDPKRCLTLTMMAVPSSRHFLEALLILPKQLRNSWYMFFFNLPKLPEYLVPRNKWAFIQRLWQDWSPNWDYPEEEMSNLKFVLSRPNILQSTLQYYRDNVLPFGFSKTFFQNQKLIHIRCKTPTFALTGVEDGCIDSDMFDLTMFPEDFLGSLKVEKILNAGHFLHREQPDIVNRFILEWILDNSPSI